MVKYRSGSRRTLRAVPITGSHFAPDVVPQSRQNGRENDNFGRKVRWDRGLAPFIG
jgi:hypothetical protein